MSTTEFTRMQFLQTLEKIASGHGYTNELTAKLHLGLLEFASETPDNLNCTKRIEVGTVGVNTGLKLSGQGLLLSDIAHSIEDLPMPEEIKKHFPGLSVADWDAFTRLTTLIYSLLTRETCADH